VKLAAIHRKAVQEGSRLVSGAQPTVRAKICDCTLQRVPEPQFLSSLQDECFSCSVTGGASVGDRRLLSDIHSGLIALSPARHTRAHDFTSNSKSELRMKHATTRKEKRSEPSSEEASDRSVLSDKQRFDLISQ
jgi:hypothetical protein